ncbi:MAG TPA: response regulator transcription factor [Polyangiaceae bacterium]|nr:response regulator transcription factor [Polyangiaceae bacterium]
MAQRILVVEDEPAIAESVAYALRRDGFEAVAAGDSQTADQAVEGAQLILLDLMLPDGSGFDLIHRWRHAGIETPIIVLSSRDDEADRIAALESGADDYVTKPFSPREVVARVRAVLRRSQQVSEVALTSEPLLRVDEATRRAFLNALELELTRVEFDLLKSMLIEPGRVYTRARLIDSVWGDGFAISDRTVDSHIKSLRRKVAEAGGDPGLIETVRGVGYRIALAEPGNRAPSP